MIKLRSLLEMDGIIAAVSPGAGPRVSTVKKMRKLLNKQPSIYEDAGYDTDDYLQTLVNKYGEDKTREFLTRSANIPGSKGTKFKFYLSRLNHIMKQ